MAAQQKVDGRTERSRRTRARIVQAAERLLLERGYLGTTIEDVAQVAGVAVQTVYYVFGTKRNLLSGVLDASIVGDLEPVPVMERPWVADLRAEGDAARAVTLLVGENLAIVARAAPVYEVLRRAAADPDVAELLAATRRNRRSVQAEMVGILHGSGHLGPGVDPAAAADVVYGLLNEEVFDLLVGDCGWSAERFRAWATGVLLDQLVGAGARP